MRALAEASTAAASSPEAGPDANALATHAAEERDHIGLWDDFVLAVGGRVDAEPTEETRKCVAAWAGDRGRPLLETLSATYAIESAQPAIARTKREGLVRHYGITETSYFSLHEQLDVEHAAYARDLISRRLAGAEQEERLVGATERALQANWTLLDGVERLIAADAS